MATAEGATEVPVVIAGAGPAGLVAAVTLARDGVGSLLVERNQALSPLPRATGVSTHTMELLRSWGLEEEVRAGQLDITDVGAFATETMASPEGVMAPLGFPDLELAARISPTTPAGVPQDHLEPVLLRHLRTFPAAQVRFGTELVAFDQDADGVTVTLRERARGAERLIRAAWLVGADGAHSRVRAGLGIAMEGPGHLAEQLTALFEAPLAEVVGDRRFGIYFIQHPEASGVFVPNGANGRWLYGRCWDPGRERLEDYDDARLRGLIRTAAGVADLPVRVVAKGAFSFAAQVAERYREGRVFLTYEAEWRPIGARRTARSAQEGPEPDGAEALAEDLNGRLPHAWLPGGDGPRRSTLDLLGRGLTLLTGPDAPVRPSLPDLPVPLTVHTVDATTAQVLGIGPVGAVLVRPDAQVAARWSTTPADPRAELAAVVPGRPEPAGSRR